MRRRTWRVGVMGIAVLGAIGVWVISMRVFPHHSLNHDEAVYLQQAAMLLDGQLNLWPPIDEVFRPWFFVEDGNRLYPKYAPIPALMFAIGQLAGDYRFALAGIAAGNLVLVAGVVREVFDRPTGIVAAAFVLGSPLFLLDSAVFLPYAPTLFLNLVFAFAYLRGDRMDDWRWAGVAGGAIGLAFFARPYTTVLFALPFIGHALWTLWQDRGVVVPRLLTTGLFGFVGVGLTLGYNIVMTGSLLVFPYQAFAPRDGLGFGHRQILGYGVEYTIDLALQVNTKVVSLLVSEWIAGGILGLLFVGIGLLVVFYRGGSGRHVTLAGLFVSILVGNVFFWGNFNILGNIDQVGDGLVAVLGPYYHFDVLVPLSAFGARGLLEIADFSRNITEKYGDQQVSGIVFVGVLLVSAGSLGVVSAGDVDDRVNRNLVVTETYERAYEPFERSDLDNSVVFLPTPYGDWLNHPFQPLRNTPGFDGTVVYVMDDRPFAVADTYPNRSLYRYGFRGPWAPFDGSPQQGRLDRVQEVNGESIHLATTVGIPRGASGVTVVLSTDEGSAYYVAQNVSDSLPLGVTVVDDHLEVTGDFRQVTSEPLGVSGRDTIRIEIFVDYWPADGFTYQIDFPVEVTTDRVRALSPRIEQCRAVQLCGGEAAYIPELAPDGVFVRAEIVGREHNS